MGKDIRVLVVRPKEPPAIEFIANSLEAMQAIVGGGYIESTTWYPRVSVMYADDPRGMACNCYLDGYGWIYGTLFFAREKLDGDMSSLTDADLIKLSYLVDGRELIDGRKVRRRIR